MRARHTLPSFTPLPALCLAGLVTLAATRCGPRDDAAPLRPDPTSPPTLVLDPERVDLGRLDPGERRTVEVAWRRQGPGPLCVLDVVPGCGCAQVEPLPRELPAGASGRLALSVEGPRRPGPLQVHAQIVTDARRRDPDRGRAVTVLTVDAWVERRLGARPGRLELHRRTMGRRVERSVEIVTAPTVSGEDLDVTLQDLEGSVALEHSAIRSPTAWTARVAIDVPLRPGPFEGALRIGIPGEPPLEIPIGGEAVR